MRIQTRINSLVLILIMLMVAAIAFARVQMEKIGEQIEGITREDIPLSEVVAKIASAKLEQAINFERALRFTTQSTKNDNEKNIAFEEAKAEFAQRDKDVYAALDQGERLAAEISKSRRIEDLRELRLAMARLEQIANAYHQYKVHANQVFELLGQGKIREAKIEALSISSEEEVLQSANRELLITVNTITQKSARMAWNVQSSAIKGMLGFSYIATVLGLSLAYIITRSITVPLRQAVQVADEIAAGNKEVDIDIHLRGEIGQLLKAMKNMLDAVNSSEAALKAQAAELARSNSELEQFAYVASHDLQEPLRMVASYTQLLARRYRGKLDPDADEFIGFAVGGVTRMQNLINDLLSYSRVGRAERVFKDVDLNQLLGKMQINLQAAISESGAKITHSNLPVIRGDEVLLTQLFQNLIGNAIKFRGEKQPIVDVSVIETEHEWSICVRDNGIGIDQQFADRIFNIFQRLHTQAEYAGTGIGLAICKKIVERHGGKIWVESKLGQGAEFHFTFPRGESIPNEEQA